MDDADADAYQGLREDLSQSAIADLKLGERHPKSQPNWRKVDIKDRKCTTGSENLLGHLLFRLFPVESTPSSSIPDQQFQQKIIQRRLLTPTNGEMFSAIDAIIDAVK
ncbi:hypothetical protein ACEK07_15355 [Alcanivoracaceae bacterium MT1]